MLREDETAAYPIVSNVPVLLGLAYIGMAYVSWTLARAILGPSGKGRQLLATPLLAAAVGMI